MINKHPTSTNRILAKRLFLKPVSLTADPSLVIFSGIKNGVPIAGATREKLTLTNLSSSDAGSYQVRVKAGAAIAQSQVAVLKVAAAYCP